MYPASDWSEVLRAIMDISAHGFSLADRPQVWAIRVTSVLMRREDRSSIVVSSLADLRRGKALGYVIDSSLASLCSFVRAWRSFLRPGLRAQAHRAQGPSGLAVALG